MKSKRTEEVVEAYDTEVAVVSVPSVDVMSSQSVRLPSVDTFDSKNDKLCVSLRSNDSDPELFDLILEEVAEEAARLKLLHTRIAGNDIAASAIVSEKRIAALKKVADLLSQRSKEYKDGSGGKVDFHGEGFQRVLTYMTTIILEATKEVGMQEATVQRFVLKLKQKLIGFEEVADRLYKGETEATTKKKAAQNASTFYKGEG